MTVSNLFRATAFLARFRAPRNRYVVWVQKEKDFDKACKDGAQAGSQTKASQQAAEREVSFKGEVPK